MEEVISLCFEAKGSGTSMLYSISSLRPRGMEQVIYLSFGVKGSEASML